MKDKLRSFVAQENEQRKMFKEKMATVPTCLEDSQWIIESLECRLSPENLYCDGEISIAEADQKYQFLMAVKSELEELIDEEVELIF